MTKRIILAAKYEAPAVVSADLPNSDWPRLRSALRTGAEAIEDAKAMAQRRNSDA
jgi:hypothetical protein